MSELRNAMHERAALVSASLRNAPEFDGPKARTAIRRKHRNRALLTSAATVAGVGIIAAIGWAGYGALQPTPAVSPSVTPSPSITPSPSVTPSPSDTALPTFEGRNPSMSDDEALARAENPATGEVWRAEPDAVEPGAWANDAFFNGYWAAPTWYVVGTRDGNDILSQGRSGYLVEVDPEGTPRLIIAPAPYQSGAVTIEQNVPIEIDAETYYDSLALPASVTTPEGDVLSLRDGTIRVMEQPVGKLEDVAAVAGSSLVRETKDSYSQAWGTDVQSLLEDDVIDTAYFIQTPYGALVQPSLDPLAVGVEWDEGFGGLDGRLGTDFFDQGCENNLEYTTALNPESAGPWLSAGTSGERTVYVPGDGSDLAEAMYANWSQAKADGLFGDDAATIESLADYVTAPAFVAVSTDNPNVWWLVLNADLSARYWC